MHRKTVFLTLVVMLIAAAVAFLARDTIRSALFNVTARENLLAQVRG
jgi:Na+-driven multidrug efflux pump